VSVNFAIKVVQRWRQRGLVLPGRIGSQKTYALAGHAAPIAELVQARPDPTAPCVIDGSINGAAIRAHVEQFPGNLVVMDNLTSRKVAGVREALETRGASLLYLPHYSPDLNPIEQAFAKLNPPAQGCCANHRCALGCHRRDLSRLLIPRVREPPRQLNRNLF
jgi:hypothetical protein